MTAKRRLPAEEGVWVFVLGDMALFGIFFNVIAYYRSIEPIVFAAGQAHLQTSIGLANTLILVTSSWCMAQALDAAHKRDRLRLQRFMFATITLGVVFVVLKLIEYGKTINAGYTLETNDFFMFYFIFTGLHLFHLVVGTVILSVLFGISRRTIWSDADIGYIEGGAVYWHLVDLLWIILFPLIYLVR